MKSNPRYVVRRARTPEPLWWIIDLQDRFGDIECRTRREARDKCREMNARTFQQSPNDRLKESVARLEPEDQT